MPRILIVDDEPNIAQMIAHALASCECEIDTANGGLVAIDKMTHHEYDVVITDIVMPDADGFAVLEFARTRPRPPAVIVITGFGTIHSAVEAMKGGASEYLTKPLNIPKLMETVQNLLVNPAHDAASSGDDFAGLIGESAPMKHLKELIARVAAGSSTVLICGESGTGKELVARAIHARSDRSGGPFVAVDCGSLSETLLESELFGHVKGAFTGAVDDRIGLFEAANGGTVFLDEVSEIPLRLQHKLLRCIQERADRPVGSPVVRKVDVRILSATNRNLAALVAEGSFREDLYYRLNVVPVPVPPLGERRGDIPLLARHFAAECARRFRRRAPKITDAVLTMLSEALWPGNVRQLENVIECAVTFAEGGEIRPEHLPPDFIESFARGRHVSAAPTATNNTLGPADVTPLGAAIRYLERQMLSKAMDAAGGNKERAAGLLGIDRATLYRKLKAHQIHDQWADDER